MWQEHEIIFDAYQVLGPLGSGGMATTYCVQSLDQSTRYAVKVPHPWLVDTSTKRAQFTSEVQHWLALPPHENLVDFYFVRETERTPVVFAEFVSGGTLAEWIERHKIRDVAHALQLGLQLVEGLSAAHCAGIVHRDLKPSNCIIDADGRLKVGDFGLASASQSQVSGADFQLSAMSPCYASPEQFDGKPTDERGDIWSFGVTLFEMLTGRRPMLGPAAPLLVQRYLGSIETTWWPDSLDQFLIECLNPLDQRFTNLGLVKQHLTAVYQLCQGKDFGVSRPPAPTAAMPSGGSASPTQPANTHQTDTRPSPSSVNQRPTNQPAAGPPSPKQPATPPPAGPERTAATRLLQIALRSVGRDPAESKTLVPPASHAHTGGGRAEVADLLAAAAILREAEKIYESMRATSQTATRFGKTVECYAVQHKLAISRQRIGDLAAAIATHRRAKTTLSQATDVDDATRLQVLFEILNNLGVCLRQSNQVSAALVEYDQAWQLLEQIDTRKLPGPEHHAVAQLCETRGMALLKSRRFAESESVLNRGMEAIGEKLKKGKTRDAEYLLAGLYINRGVVRRNSGRVTEAIDDYGQAIAILEAGVLSADKEIELAMAFMNRAAAFLNLSRYADALPDAEQAVVRFEPLVRTKGMETQILPLSQAYNNRSQILMHLRRLKEAEADCDRCVELRRKLVEKLGKTQHSVDLGKAYINQMVLKQNMGDPESAARIGEATLAWLAPLIVRQPSSDGSAVICKLHSLLAMAAAASGRADQAVAAFENLFRDLRAAVASGSADAVELLLESLNIAMRAASQPGFAALSGLVQSELTHLLSVVQSGKHLSAPAVRELRSLRNAPNCAPLVDAVLKLAR